MLTPHTFHTSAKSSQASVPLFSLLKNEECSHPPEPEVLCLEESQHSQRFDLVELSGDNKAEILEHFLSLPSQDLYLRFGQAKSVTQLEKYSQSFQKDRDYLLGVFSGHQLVAFCHMAKYLEEGRLVAEIGISLLCDVRGQGVATKMVSECRKVAAQSGIESLQLHYRSENRGMAALCRKFEAKLFAESGDVCARITVPEA